MATTNDTTTQFAYTPVVVGYELNPDTAIVANGQASHLKVMRARYSGRCAAANMCRQRVARANGGWVNAGEWVVYDSSRKAVTHCGCSPIVRPIVERQLVEHHAEPKPAPRPATTTPRSNTNMVNCVACGEFRPGVRRPNDAPVCYQCQRQGY